MRTIKEEREKQLAREEARSRTLKAGSESLGTDRFGRLQDFDAGSGLYRLTPQMSDLAAEAAQGLSANREAKRSRGIVSQETAESEGYQNQRKLESANNSTARRVLREVARSQQNGRASNWLKRYAAARETEFNTQNAVAQSQPGATGSIASSRLGSSGPGPRPQNSNSSSSGGIPSAPSGGTFVLGSVNGTIQWIATTNC